MNKTDENLNTSISGQFRSSPFYMFASSLPAGIAMALFGTWACYACGIPEEAAKSLALQIQIACLSVGTAGSISGGIGTVQRGVAITKGKIMKQIEEVKPE